LQLRTDERISELPPERGCPQPQHIRKYSGSVAYSVLLRLGTAALRSGGGAEIRLHPCTKQGHKSLAALAWRV
jgi:hypothetical protein